MFPKSQLSVDFLCSDDLLWIWNLWVFSIKETVFVRLLLHTTTGIVMTSYQGKTLFREHIAPHGIGMWMTHVLFVYGPRQGDAGVYPTGRHGP